MTSRSSNRFGGANEATLEKVAATAGNTISVDDIGSKEAFIEGWVSTLSAYGRQLIASNSALTAPACVAFVPDVGAFGRENAWQRRAMLGSGVHSNLEGVLAVGTGPIGGYVFPNSLVTIEEIEKKLYEFKLQGCPTIALTSATKVVIWPNGVESEQPPIACAVGSTIATIGLNSIDKKLTNFYEDIARQTTDWWKSAKERITVEEPEETVQFSLWAFLSGSYTEIAKVKKEYHSGNGRADITVLPTRPLTADKSAVIELKTIRDVRTPKPGTIKPNKISKKDNIDWARAGVQQTAAYRDHEKLDVAFLCVYDFCKSIGVEVMASVTPLALQHNVVPRHYWITSSHEEHRKDRYPEGDKVS